MAAVEAEALAADAEAAAGPNTTTASPRPPQPQPGRWVWLAAMQGTPRCALQLLICSLPRACRAVVENRINLLEELEEKREGKGTAATYYPIVGHFLVSAARCYGSQLHCLGLLVAIA